ncbi:MAG: tetratricopeptide repeat protein [Oscillospiraceae bacterium]|nr:tetratricopeptide repeat protein [Oscillospiraceae bacterium]
MKKLLAIILAILITLTTFTACAATDQALVSMYLNLGEKYLLDLDYEQAIVYFNKVIEVEPRNSRAYMGAAEAYVGLGDTESAINLLKTALEVFSDDEEVTIELLEMLIEIDPETSEWYITLVEIYEAKGDSDSAIAILSNAVEAVTDGDSLTVLLEKLIDLDPTNVNWYLKLAQVYVDSSDRTSAISILRQGMDVVGNAKTQLYDKLIEIDSDTIQWYFELAGVYEDQSNIPSAVDTLELGLNNFEDDDTKIDFSEELIEIDETNAEWYLTIAYIYIDQNDTDAAIAILREGLEKASDTTEIEALLNQLAPDTSGLVTTSSRTYNEDGTLTYSYDFSADGGNSTYTISSTDSDGVTYTQTFTSEYDSNGNEVKSTNKSISSDGNTNTIITTYEYDSNGNMTKEEYNSVSSSGETYSSTSTYEYDANGNKISGTQVFNSRGSTYEYEYEYEYDTNGKLTMELRRETDGSYYYKTEYEYDLHGNVSQETETSAYIHEAYSSTSITYKNYEYEYDANENITKIDVSYSYYDSSEGGSHWVGFFDENGYDHPYGSWTQEYEYDEQGSTISRTYTDRSTDGTVITNTYIIEREYIYDDTGRISRYIITEYYANSGNVHSVRTMERID